MKSRLPRIRPLPLECADMSALWNCASPGRAGQCRAVGKRRHVAALQMLYSGLFVVLCSVFNPALAESLLLTGATVHTVSGETLAPGQVLIKDGKIAAVGRSLSAAGATALDLKGQH